MLAVRASEDIKWGCPNCGCDTWIRDSSFRSDQPAGTCRGCKLHYQILADDAVPEVKYGTDRKDADGNTIMETAIFIKHPRKGIEAWHWEAPDVRPKYGEYWSPRGIGYDLSGFVRSKQAGERILDMVKEVLEVDEPKSWLDYRKNEPSWIQFKFQNSEFDLEKLQKLVKENKGIITIEIIKQCKLNV